MSYLKEFADKLASLLGDVPEDRRAEIVSFAQNAVYASYKNGLAKGQKTPAKPSSRSAYSTTKRGSVPRK